MKSHRTQSGYRHQIDQTPFVSINNATNPFINALKPIPLNGRASIFPWNGEDGSASLNRPYCHRRIIYFRIAPSYQHRPYGENPLNSINDWN